MIHAMYSVVSSGLNCQKRLEVLTNNLANMNTIGFKRDMLALQVPEEGEDAEGSGDLQTSPPASFITRMDLSPGAIEQTKNVLDFALVGEGFFCVETPGGTRYTRNGSFALDEKGLLVTKDGFPVLGDRGKITIGGTEVLADDEGNLSVDGNAIGKIRIVDIPRAYAMKKEGGTLFSAPDREVQEGNAEVVKVHQGFVEGSNVNGIKMMTEMIDVLRGYESYQKVIQTLDESTRKSISELGTLS